MSQPTDAAPLLKPDQNCWRIERADQVGFLVAGEAYFRALRRALLQAERHAVILAWDLHSEILLERDDADPEDGLPGKLGPFLNAVLEQNPQLELHLLVWDFSMIYAAEREWRFFSESLGDPNPRLHLHYDDQLPASTSHHQKVVVIDDALAFAGGLDLSQWRWDSAEHRLHDDRRTDPEGAPYDPYHDIQMAVTGPAALALGDLCADRWQRATGNDLPRRDAPRESVPWPDTIEVAFKDVDIGIARTYAAFEPWPEVQEIERLHLDVIASAQDYIYFENQYFSTRRLMDAMVERLRASEGPEIIIVLTQQAGGWLEEGTMGVLRDRLFEMLTAADQHNRLRIYRPEVSDDRGDETKHVYVHAKIFIADHRIIKIGSSNLSNRSMRVDSEVDLVIERPQPEDAVRQWLHRLLAVHFGCTREEVAAKLQEAASLGAGIDSMISDSGHSLKPFDFGCDSDLEREMADSQLLDPEEPLDPDYWIRNFVPKEERPSVLKRLTYVTLLVAAGLLISFLMKEGWGNVIDKETVLAYLESIQSQPWTPVLLIGIFALAGLVGLPINLVLIAATIAIGPWVALVCGYAGAHLSALTGFGLGHLLGKPLLRRWQSEKLARLSQQLRNRGILSVVLVRVLPVAPFVIVNLVAGASHLKFRVFNLGTLLGMAPGMAAVVLLTHQLNSAINQPGWGTAMGFAVAVTLIGGAVLFVRHALVSRSSASPG